MPLRICLADTDLGLTVSPYERPRPRAVREHRLAPWFAVGTVCFGAFMGQLDASIVTLAFPAIQREFDTSLASVQWVSLSYLLVLITLLVPVGGWSDRAGRKLVYLYGFAVFTAASAACGLAWSLTALVGLRAIQAVGAAMLQANSVALVYGSVAPTSRRAALGVQAAAQAIGLALGPLVGGALVTSAGWRWIFLVNVPVGIVAMMAGWFLLPRTRDRIREPRADPWGAALLVAATTSLLLVLSGLSGLALPSWANAVLAGVAVSSVAGLAWWERRATTPLLDPSILSAPGVAPALSGALLAYFVLFGPLVLYPQLLTSLGLSELRVGLMLTALPAGFGVAAVTAERLVPHHWSNGRRGIVGSLTATVAAALQALPMPTGVVVLLLGLLGAGLGVFIPANNATIMSAIPAGHAATAGGIVNVARGLGTALGVAVVTLLLRDRATLQHDASSVMLCLALAGAVATLTAVRSRGPAR